MSPSKSKANAGGFHDSTVTVLPLASLHADPMNPNRCSPETLAKIRASIERTRFYSPILVVDHPSIPKEYLIVDGHHRVLVLQDLGHTEAQCIVLTGMRPENVRLLLASLNRLRGEDNPRKKAELLEELSGYFSLEDLSTLLHESRGEIDDLLALLKTDMEEQEKAVKALLEDVDKDLPQVFNFMVSANDAPIVIEALQKHQPEGEKDPSLGLVGICKFSLEPVVISKEEQ